MRGVSTAILADMTTPRFLRIDKLDYTRGAEREANFMSEIPVAPPLLTADLPGIGGVIKAQPEDFEVAEIPAYEPCGSGDFLYLWVEKRDMGAEYFTRQIAK